MNSLLSQLLINLAQKEAAEKELLAMVESLEVLVAALIASLSPKKSSDLISSIEHALAEMRERNGADFKSDIDLLSHNLSRITAVSKRR
ncbi:sigma-S stabilization anti-adapter protein IraP [Acerihabitans sp. KWT182]|uniref:Sigma-S stabilization anti-adapter protein IraP n=1 Tax=Acerihabitans sp. KWT182 TaxID=3157919 RepID=A0AAU7QE10_9GAMM